jgi:CheY-specific phosphatase CheX
VSSLPVAVVAPATPTVDAWLVAAEESFGEVAATALARGDVAAVGRSATAPPGLGGAYIQLLSEREVVLVGLCADDAALRHISGALLSLAAGELGHADVTDAVGEIVNMLAGGVKRRLSAACPGLQLGLPIFIQGHLDPRERQQLRVGQLRLGPDVVVNVVLLYEPRSSSGGGASAR